MAEEIHHVFKTSLKWSQGKQGVSTPEGKPPLDVASPVVFGGPEGVWSPQDLFISAVEVCNMTTFMSIIHRRGIELESLESEAEGVLETTDEGVVFTSITIRPRVKVKNPEDTEKVMKLLERAHQHCQIGNSIKTKVVVEIE